MQRNNIKGGRVVQCRVHRLFSDQGAGARGYAAQTFGLS